MISFSANLGFLWQELPLIAALDAARQAGFTAVECHWPYDTGAGELRAALKRTGLPLLGINTAKGNGEAGEFGLSALPERVSAARQAIEEAIDYAREAGSQAIHVMAGKIGSGNGLDSAERGAAHATYTQNLRFACRLAAKHDITILIEPINHFDVPDYFLSTTLEAHRIISELAEPNLKLLYDCYHIARMGEDVKARFLELLPLIGHVQFAAVPDRGPPDHGELDYRQLFRFIAETGYDQPLGAEYRPNGPTSATLAWMKTLL